MDLFAYEPPANHHLKTAAIQMDEDAARWPRQVLVELFRAIPESSEYTPEVMFLKMDNEQGYGLGVIIISNATDSALAATRKAASHRALVPVVVKNHKMAPLDILMSSTGKIMPLTGSRLREALFRPETFEMITEDWGDQSLYNMFYPPGRSDNAFGAGMSQNAAGQGGVSYIQGPGMKYSGAAYPLLGEVVAKTAQSPDLQELAARVEGVGPQFHKNAAFMGALQLLAEIPETATAAEYQKLAEGLATDYSICQLGYDTDRQRYWVKTANPRYYDFYSPVQYLNRGELLKQAGPALVQKVDHEGTITLSTKCAEPADPDTSTWKIVDEPGIYKVKTVHGKEMTGWVIPRLHDLDGSQVPMCVFTNGAAAMVQDQIAGARIASGVDLPAGPPRGSGIFYVAGQGGIEASVPLIVSGSEAAMDGGTVYHVQTLTGETGKVRVMSSVNGMRALGGDLIVSGTAKFLPLEDEQMVPLVDRPDQVDKTASFYTTPRIHIQGGGFDYRLTCYGMPKLASSLPARMGYDDATLVLCAAGVSPQEAHTKLAGVADGGEVDVVGLSDVRPLSELRAASQKEAAQLSKIARDLRRDLVKEAANLPDVMTVDAVLSLGFINSENLRMYVSRLPYLEQCMNMVGELLLASRLGLAEIPEFAAARAIRGLDEVIQGLRSLALRSPSDPEPG